jgi:hypothetical protein
MDNVHVAGFEIEEDILLNFKKKSENDAGNRILMNQENVLQAEPYYCI